jgi:parvulin-like peptidyl-prolyl isomerase
MTTTLRMLTVAAVAATAMLAGACAPSVNVLPPRSPQERRAAELEAAVAEIKGQKTARDRRTDAPAEVPPPPVDPGRAAMERAVYDPDPSVVGTVVASVNGEIITREDVLRDIRPQLDAVGRDETLTEVGRDMRRRDLIGAVLLLKVERLLALQEARRVIPAEESERIEADAQAVLADVMRALGSMARMEVMLRQEGRTVASQKQAEVDNRRIRALLNREVEAHVDVTPGEVQKYYASHKDEFALKAQVQAREIFVSVAKQETVEAAEARAKALRGRVTAGEDFAAVAKSSSDGPNAADGGLWDWATAGAGTFRPEVAAAAFALRKGEISEVIVSEIGAHLLKAEDARPARTLSASEAQDEIVKKLRNAKRNDLYSKLIRRLWDKSTVDIRWR